jgi:hypothetical protein
LQQTDVTPSDGEARRFITGEVLLVEDVSVKDHKLRVVGDFNSLAVMVQLRE